MSDADARETMEAFYRGYIDRFNAADARAMAALFDYPAVLAMAGGVVELTDAEACTSFYARVIGDVRGRDWHRSAIDGLQAFPLADDGGLIVADYSRHRADGSVIERGRTAYVLRRRDGAWQISSIIDKLGAHPAEAR